MNKVYVISHSAMDCGYSLMDIYGSYDDALAELRDIVDDPEAEAPYETKMFDCYNIEEWFVK